MTREMFLSQLRMNLQGKVSGDKILENINYYSEYIIEEIRKGKSEKDVLEMLGDPSLLAKTIITADAAGKQGKNVEENSGESGYGSREEQWTRTTGYFNGGQAHMAGKYKWWQKLLFVLAIVMVILLMIAIVSGVIRILTIFAIPVIIVMIVIRILGRWR